MKWNIQTKVVFTLFSVLVVVMTIFMVGVYMASSGTAARYLEDLAKSSADRAALLAAEPLKQQDPERILELFSADTMEPRVHAVVVKKPGSPEVYAGVMRTEDDAGWKAIHSEKAIMKNAIKETRQVSLDGAVVGVVDYYISNRFTVGAMRSIMVKVGVLCALVTVVLVAVLLLSLRRVVIRPLKAVSDVMHGIAQGGGDLTVRLKVEKTDEIGELAQSFNTFVSNIQGLVAQVMESAETLATFTSQISATASELSTSAVEASSTLSQVSATAEEIKQTSIVSHEKAEMVAQNAEEAARVSDDGKTAANEAAEGMKRIKDEMEFIAESIVRLSEHSQSIGEIIGAVNDLANESNLLSVNASIEAAKAGEFGKGFGVVAQEVKSLSDQSKDATSQVKAILNDIQTATSTAVMAMERGASAVESGDALASRSGEAISNLSQRVENAARSASQISASSQQQLMGLDQLTTAMESIKIASAQNADGAKQLEQATARMHELGQELKKLSGQFKVA